MNLNWHSKQVQTYDKEIANKIAGYDLLYEISGHFLSRHSQPLEKMLIIGAGGGQELLSFSSVLPHAHFTALDYSKPMLIRAQERTQQVKNNIDFVHTNWHDYEVASTFDAVSCLLVLHFVEKEQQKNYIDKIYQCIKPGSILLIATMLGDAPDAMNHQLTAWGAYMQQHGITLEHAAQFATNYADVYHLLTEEELVALLTASGFTSVSRYFQSFLLAGYICIK